MKVDFSEYAWEDYLYWLAHDVKTLHKINELIEQIRRHPFTGSGKPEPLKGQYVGYWSRRITQEHRIIYKVSGSRPAQVVYIQQMRNHY